MGWIVVGVVTAIVVEIFIRVFSGYQPASGHTRRNKVTVDIPWYGKALLGVGVWRWLTKK